MLLVLSGASDPGKYGVGYFQPDDCDHDAKPCVFTPYPEYENLKKAYTSTKKSSLTMETYSHKHSEPSTCPVGYNTMLPPSPQGE